MVKDDAIRGEVEITQTIDLISKDGKAYGEFINGVNININSHEDLLQAWLLAKESRGDYLIAPAAQRLVQI